CLPPSPPFPYPTLFRSTLGVLKLVVDLDVEANVLAVGERVDLREVVGEVHEREIGRVAACDRLTAATQERRGMDGGNHRPNTRRSEEHTSELQSRENLV